MAYDFSPLNENDTREFRKEIGLPTTKEIVYYHRDKLVWVKKRVVDYKVADQYQPSGAYSLYITLEDGSTERILAEYLADMQKTTFTDGQIVDNSAVNVDSGYISKMEADYSSAKRTNDSPKTYVVVDLETTGTNHFIDEIIEIGAIKYVDGKEEKRLSVLIKQPKPLSKKIVSLTGITDEMLANEGKEKDDAIMELYMFMENSIIVGHNFASFDSKFIEDAFVDVLKCHFSNRYVDTLYFAREKCKDLNHHSLEALSEVYNVDYSNAHRALEDCVINHLIYEKMLNNEPYGSAKEDENNDIEADVDYQLIDVDDIRDWKSKIVEALIDYTNTHNLPQNSLCLMANISKKTGLVTSYSVCIYEPDLIEDSQSFERNVIVARITEGKLKSDPDILTIESREWFKPNDIFCKNATILFKTPKNIPYVRINKNEDEIISIIIDIIEKSLIHYVPKAASFACCSKFIECSEKKKCVHRNLLFAKACQYRKNIENNRIFY